jgi:glycosyltransferase involved in cell wall biosynthesis
MYEACDIPKSWIPKIQGADLIVVPCEHNKRLFRKYTDKPIEVCLEGVLTDKFSYVDRQFPKWKPFRFLWFGATNQRKGFQYAIGAWRLLQLKYPEISANCELYMKTTQNIACKRITGFKDGKPIKELMPKERIFKTENAIVDTRKVSEEELTKIYHDAHCFLFPTMGEGFGLTLAEAMSTGLPSIYTPWSGPVDFCSNKEGYSLKFKMGKVESQIARLDGNHIKDCVTHAAEPDIEHLVRRMVQVYSDYDRALSKGRRAADRIRKEITWDISAKRFMDIIRSYR